MLLYILVITQYINLSHGSVRELIVMYCVILAN